MGLAAVGVGWRLRSSSIAVRPRKINSRLIIGRRSHLSDSITARRHDMAVRGGCTGRLIILTTAVEHQARARVEAMHSARSLRCNFNRARGIPSYASFDGSDQRWMPLLGLDTTTSPTPASVRASLSQKLQEADWLVTLSTRSSAYADKPARRV